MPGAVARDVHDFAALRARAVPGYERAAPTQITFAGARDSRTHLSEIIIFAESIRVGER
jgi:hypothetical protein